MNEPGITESYKYFNNYNKIINYINCHTAIYKVLNNDICKNMFCLFEEEIKKSFKDNKERILNNIKEKFDLDDKIFYVAIYSMEQKLRYKHIYEEIKKLK